MPKTQADIALRPLRAGTPARPLAWLMSVCALAALGACASYTGIEPVARTIDPRPFGLQDPGPVSSQTDQDTDWWLTLGDAQLTQLINTALEHNPTLRSAQARIARAESFSRLTGSADGPHVSAGLNVERQLFSANSIYPPPYGGSEYDSGALQLNASWELDFFNKNGAALQGALGQERAAQADLRAARSLLAAQVARTYYTLARIDAQAALAGETLNNRHQLNQLTQARLQAGLDTQLELRQSESALPDTELQREQLREQRDIALNALAALCAQPVQTLQVSTTDPTNAGIAPLPGELPLDLLSRRPDLTAARWRMEAATQDIHSARAQFYPNINLAAFAGFASIGLDKLLTSKSSNWRVGPAINLPLLDAGRLRAQLQAKTTDLDAAVESYNAQVLQAVHEVADQLSIAQSVQRQQAQQAAAQRSAEQRLQIAQERYAAGLGTYLNVLNAAVPVLTQRRQAIDLAARSLDTRVQMLHAIGGAAPASTSAQP